MEPTLVSSHVAQFKEWNVEAYHSDWDISIATFNSIWFRSGATEHVLMGVFAPSEGPTSQPQRRTGFCSYTLKYINKLFDQNIHMCFNGTMQDRNLPYISGQSCLYIITTITWSFDLFYKL